MRRPSAGRSLRIEILEGVYRRRVWFEWRVAAVVAGTATLGAVLAWTPWTVGVGWWITLTFVALVLGLVAVVVAIYLRPLPADALVSRYGDRTLAAAVQQVRRGVAVDPPDLELDASTQVQRGLRVAHLSAGWLPVLGASWTLGLSVGTPGSVFAVAGIVPILFGVGFLARSGVVLRRLDALQAARHSAP